MSGLWTVLIGITGLIALFFMFVPNAIGIYVVFAFAFVFRRRFTGQSEQLLLFRFVLAVLLSTVIYECLDWLRYFWTASETGALVPPLYHPQLVPNLMIALSYALGWALAWWLILQRYKFTLLQVFIVHGLYGVLTEEGGNILRIGGENLPESGYLWAYTFIVYGALMALAYLPFREIFAQLETAQETRFQFLRYILIFPALYIISYITFFIIGAFYVYLDLIPAKGSILERPYY